MTPEQQAAVQLVIGRARDLATALRRSQRDRGAAHVAGLVDDNIAKLEKAVASGEARAIVIALVFPSIDGRSLDFAGGVDLVGSIGAAHKALVTALSNADRLF